MKTHIIYCVSAQIPCLIKFLFLGYGPKCSQPIRLQNFLINHISKTNQWNFDFLNVDTNSCQLKVDLIIFGWAWWEVSMDEISIEWIDRMNWYFACWCKFTLQSYFSDFGVGVVRNGHGNWDHETLKSAECKEWVYEWSWFFACWLWSNNFWLDQHCTLYIWLLNASLEQLYLLDPWK